MSILSEPLSLADAAVWAVIRDDDRYRVLDALVSSHFMLSETVLHSGRETQGHSHPWPEVYFFSRGTGMLKLDGVEQFVGPGSIVVIAPDVHHQVCAVSGLRMTFYAVFEGDATRQPPARAVD